MYRDRHESYQCSNHYNVDRLCRVYSFSQSIDIRFECVVFFFQAEDGIRDLTVTGVQTCALPIYCDSIAGDTVTIQETGGKTAKGCKGPGAYKFRRPNENTLTFTLVSDTCKEREKKDRKSVV